MKLIAITTILACAFAKSTATSRIGALKKSIEGVASKTFLVSEDQGRLSVRMSLVAQKNTLAVSSGWNMLEEGSQLQAAGYTQWKGAPAGIELMDAKEQVTTCTAVSGENDQKDSLLFHMQCKKNAAKPAAAFVQGADVTYAADDAHAHAAPWNANGSDEVPFGWKTSWGVWDYPYYTVTTQGILGCRSTDADYCTPQSADMFPFDPAFDWENYMRDPKAIYEVNGKTISA